MREEGEAVQVIHDGGLGRRRSIRGGVVTVIQSIRGEGPALTQGSQCGKGASRTLVIHGEVVRGSDGGHRGPVVIIDGGIRMAVIQGAAVIRMVVVASIRGNRGARGGHEVRGSRGAAEDRLGERVGGLLEGDV